MGSRNFLHKILDAVSNRISSEDYKDRSRISKSNFSRNRKLGFCEYIKLILGNKGRSLQLELDDFLKRMRAPFDTYSKQAFSRQRQFIRPEAVQELLYFTSELFYRLVKYKTFRGFILTAIDGTRLNLPDSKSLEAIYGTQDSNGTPQIQALSSTFYDVLNHVILDSSLNPCRANERNLAKEHFKVLTRYEFSKVLVLLDRGYPSGEMVNTLEQRHLSYVMRCPSTFPVGIKLDSSDCIVDHKFRKCSRSYKIRFLRFEINNNPILLASNILDESFTIQDFKEIYHIRWEIETAYKHLKSYAELENFSGITNVAVLQDFYASCFLLNLAQMALFESEREFNNAHNSAKNKHRYKQSLASVIGYMKDSIVKMLSCSSASYRQRKLRAILKKLLRYTTAICPGRSYPHQKKHFARKSHNSLKRVF